MSTVPLDDTTALRSALEGTAGPGDGVEVLSFHDDAADPDSLSMRVHFVGSETQTVPLSANFGSVDFPLTDNTVIDINHRFAVQIVDMYRESARHPEYRPQLTVQVYWFPKGFVTERERPAYYSGQSKADGYE